MAIRIPVVTSLTPNHARQLFSQRGERLSWKCRAALTLGLSGPTAVAEFDRLVIDSELKAVILAHLAERHPAMRAEYLAAAARFNVRRRPPYQLVRQVIDRKP